VQLIEQGRSQPLSVGLDVVDNEEAQRTENVTGLRSIGQDGHTTFGTFVVLLAGENLIRDLGLGWVALFTNLGIPFSASGSSPGGPRAKVRERFLFLPSVDRPYSDVYELRDNVHRSVRFPDITIRIGQQEFSRDFLRRQLPGLPLIEIKDDEKNQNIQQDNG
jgi:hypothetical protein